MPPKFTPNQPKAGRYWPGKPLDDVAESSSEDEEEEEGEEGIEEQKVHKEQLRQVVQESPRKADGRLVTATKLVTTMKSTTISEEGPYMPREDESLESESEEEEEEEEPEQRASRIRQARRRAVGEFIAADRVDLEEEGGSSEESSEEESSEEEIISKRPLMRPTFVPKNQRDKADRNGNVIGLANYGATDDDEMKQKRQEQRREEAIKFVEGELRHDARRALEAELDLEANRGIEEVDDTDDLDPESDKAAWKLRELQRIKREREALIARELEREELERRRNMDESERLKEDYARKREIEEGREKTRGKMEFMQKYYHKGAFYQDDDLLKRDYNVATAEEHRNKEVLPISLQVRSGELGRASRTKWTHLSAEDTSQRDSPWFDQYNDANKRALSKMGGMHDPNDRERKRRR